MRALVIGFLGALCCWPGAVWADVSLDGTIVDLSYAYDAKTIYWPTEEGFVLEKEFAGRTEKGYFYASNRFRSAEHGGTHIDAPLHFAQGHSSVDEIPLRQLIGGAVLIDVVEACRRDRDHAISVWDVERWERAHGEIPRGSIVLFRTGFGQFWPDRKRYLGTEERGSDATAKLHFPGLDPQAARWLLTKRAIHAVGLDTASIDPGRSTLFESHQILFQANVPAFENLAALDRLPERGFSVIALPMKIAGGTGGPLRIVAIVPAARR